MRKLLTSDLFWVTMTLALTSCQGLGAQNYVILPAAERQRLENSSRVVLDVVCTNLVKRVRDGATENPRLLDSIPKAWQYQMTLEIKNVAKGVIDTDELNVNGWRDLNQAEKTVMNLPTGFGNGLRMRIGFESYAEGAFLRLKLMPWPKEMADIFPILAPRARANPSIRHPITVRVPTGLRVIRTDDTLTIGWESLQETNLTVGTNMVLGCTRETRISRNGVPGKSSESEYEFNEWFGGGSAGTVVDFGSSDTVLHRKYGHALLPANAYSVEYRCVVFETDIPPQHFWQPIGGKYRVLWEHNFKETSKPG